jgi:hypothetical protein
MPSMQVDDAQQVPGCQQVPVGLAQWSQTGSTVPESQRSTENAPVSPLPASESAVTDGMTVVKSVQALKKRMKNANERRMGLLRWVKSETPLTAPPDASGDA